ncbi:MAG: septum formation initiator family protein [Bacteroidota bacterium]
MNGDFYRAIPKPRHLQGLVKRLLKNRRRMVSLLIAVVAAVYLLFDNKGIIRRTSLELQKRDLTEKLAQARKETQYLHAHLKAVEGDKKTIEKLARERYGMARDGETVYRVKKD